MRRFAISAFGAVLCLAFSTLFTQEVLSAEKAQRLCLVNSPAELIACRRGDSLYYQQPGLVHGKYLLDFAAQYCDTNFEINIQFPYVLCVYSGVKEKIAAQEIRRKEMESNMLSALRRLGKELDNPVSGWKQISSEDEKRFLITSQGTGSVIQDGDEVTIDFSQVCERSSQWCELRYSQCKQLTEHGEERCIKLREVAGFSAVRTIFQIVGPRKILHCLLGK